MEEQFCDVGRGITLCYETFGERSNPTALLVMGLGTQMVAWHEDFCRQLAARGFYVVRFDNRDIGRSTHVGGPPPTIGQLLLRSKRAARYTLADMAADAAGLLHELGLAPAHVIGASMGGMIAQTLAARHPQDVRSLTSIMSNTGALTNGQPALRLYPFFLRRRPVGLDEYVAHFARMFAAIGSTGLPREPEEIRALAGISYERDHDAAGPGRQLAAIIAAGDRTRELRKVSAPTLVIHGTADPLVSPSGGRATARAIKGAKLMTVAGMGHDMPRAAWPELVEAIVENTGRAGWPPGPPPCPPPLPIAPPWAVGVGASRRPSIVVRPPAALRQSRHRVRAPGRARGLARADAHQPMEIVPAVRAAVRPAAVQRAEHPLLLTTGQPHRRLPSLRLLVPEARPIG